MPIVSPEYRIQPGNECLPVIVRPVRGFPDRHDKEAATTKLFGVMGRGVGLKTVRERRVGPKRVVQRACADRKQNVGIHCPEFGIKESFSVVVIRVGRVVIRDVWMGIRKKRLPKLRGVAVRCRSEAYGIKDALEAFASDAPGEWDTRHLAPVNARVIADDVEIGVRIPIAENRPPIGAHPERVRRLVSDVLHDCSRRTVEKALSVIRS